jgi:DNA-binding transcriptional regulator YhcF (GntR family)
VGKDRYQPGGSKDRGPKFIKIEHWILKTAAWRDLDPVARALYVELRQRYNGTNNGNIGLGTREASECLKVGRNTVARAFDDLITRGFLKVATASTFHQKRLAREWLLTDEKDDRTGEVPTKEFTRWTVEKQKLVPSESRIGSPESHEFSSITRRSAHSPASEPMGRKVTVLQSRVGATYRSTTGGAA